MDTRTRRSIALLAASLAGVGLPRHAGATTCDAIVGKWAWFTGGIVSIDADGTIAHDPGNDGTWECTDRTRGQAALRWRLGGYVNRLALSPDGKALSSTDPAQAYVTAKRVEAPWPAEALRRADPEPPKAKAPEPPRRADAEGPKVKAPDSPRRAGPEPAKPKAPEAPGDISAPARVSAGPCSGTACRDLPSDMSRCTATNTGAKAVKVRAYSGDRASENAVPPGRASICRAARRSPGSRPCT